MTIRGRNGILSAVQKTKSRTNYSQTPFHQPLEPEGAKAEHGNKKSDFSSQYKKTKTDRQQLSPKPGNNQ
jgi:hypothetical protein